MVNDEGIKNPERFLKAPLFSKDEAVKAMDYVAEKTRENINDFTDKFPSSASSGLMYGKIDNNDWTNGFFTGLLWLCYEYTGEIRFKKTAELQCESFKNRIENKISVDHHDMGFLYSPSCVAGYNITNNPDMKNSAVSAANQLITRFREKGEFIQAWGELGPQETNRMIIDCMNNLPLLFWASEVTGDMKYSTVAKKHAITTLKNIVRKDASTHHTFYFDVETGKPLKGVTSQGYSDDSAWARGQAWGISGFSIAYRYTKIAEFTDVCCKIANFFLNRLPGDYIPYWDLIFDDMSNQERDSSAAAIAACGLIELSGQNVGKYKPVYDGAISAVLRSLTDNYTTKNEKSNGILQHGVYNKPEKIGVDECMIWGDYYYAEALMHIINPKRKSCW